ncbi:AraC family transcriptional regulator [Billgrantia endophytica]|nr:AraC family transcriptional regulator [Halomonas endophytica]
MSNEMMRAEIWLQDNLASQQGIEDLAIRLGYSTSQVRRKFKQCFGLSPSAYRDMLRLEMAARLLAFTPYRIHTIASRCGYRNHSAFSRAFHRRHLLTPRQYRQTQHQKLRECSYRDAHGGDPPPIDIRKMPPRQALVTRLYGLGHLNDLHDLQEWTASTRQANTLPDRLKQAPVVAVIHGIPLPSQMQRVDIGPLVDDQVAATVAIPAAFRLLELPAQHYACVVVKSLNEVPSTMEYVISHELPRYECHASGEAVQLHCHPRGMELQLPLLDVEWNGPGGQD